MIADNASTDGTALVAARLERELPSVSFLRLERKGRGRALRAAWSLSDAQVVCYMDVDLSTDLRGLLPLVAPLLSGHSDLAIGTRLAHGARVVRGPKREVISRAYNGLLRCALRARFSDAQCGFKAVRAELVPDLLPAVRDDGWFFDTELLVTAQRRGLRIHEVPVDWIDDPDSRVALVRTAVDDLRGVARLMAGRADRPLRGGRRREHCCARAAVPDAARRCSAPSARTRWRSRLTAIGNTAANRRFTFGVRGRAGLLRHHLRGGLVFVLTLALTNCALLVLHGIDADAAARGRAGRARRGQPHGDRDPLRRDAHVGLRPAPPLRLTPTHHHRQENRMNPRSRTLAIVLGAAALAGAAGIGVAATGDSAASNASPSMSRPGGPGGGGGFDLAALADELGVSESRLQEALEAARPSGGGPGAGRSDLAETLAEELGLSVDEVEAALEATMPSGGPGGGPPGSDGMTPPGDGTTPLRRDRRRHDARRPRTARARRPSPDARTARPPGGRAVPLASRLVATADLTVIALGRPDASASAYIAEIHRRLEAQDRVRFSLHAMGTSLEGSTEDILAIVAELHAVPFEQGVPRVYTVLKLDERRDREQTLDDKVASVRRLLDG